MKLKAIILACLILLSFTACNSYEKPQSVNNIIHNEDFSENGTLNEDKNIVETSEEQNKASNVNDDIKEDEDEQKWPDNEYTMLIPYPEIDANVISTSTIGMLFTFDVDWTLEDGTIYAQQLSDAGFGDDCAEKFEKYGYIDRTANGVNVQLLELRGKVTVSIMATE